MSGPFLKIAASSLVLIAAIVLFQNFTTTTASNLTPQELQSLYAGKISSTIDFWHAQDINAYSTGHKCKPTSVSGTAVSADGEMDYLTPKIHRLGLLLEGLAKIYPHVDAVQRDKIISTSRKTYFWLYRQIDWEKMLVKDDYGTCYKGNSKAYSHLTTPHVLFGLLAFRSILPTTDAAYAKLSSTIEALAVGHLRTTDGWMTPIGEKPKQLSANFMALNLSVVSLLSIVNPQNSYVKNHLNHRLITDYAWIRTSFDNYSNEQKCGAPLLYGGWSHQTPENAALNLNVTFSCSQFNQAQVDSVSKSMRSYYLQKVSYHTIITKGLLDIRRTLLNRNACGLVNYGSQGTCQEMSVLLRGSSAWTYNMIRDDGSIPTAYRSFPIDEFGYFSDNYGTAVGIANLVKVLHEEAKVSRVTSFNIKYGYENVALSTISTTAMKPKLLKSLELAIRSTSISMLFTLEDTPYLVGDLQ